VIKDIYTRTVEQMIDPDSDADGIVNNVRNRLFNNGDLAAAAAVVDYLSGRLKVLKRCTEAKGDCRT